MSDRADTNQASAAAPGAETAGGANAGAPTPAAPTSAAPTSTAPTPPAPGEAVTADQVRMALRRVKDPELALNIIDLGLVYGVTVEDSAVSVDMSLTSPGCPSGPEIMESAEAAIRAIPGVAAVSINLVWSPMWSPERIEPRVRAYLGF